MEYQLHVQDGRTALQDGKATTMIAKDHAFSSPGIATLKGIRILLVEDSWHVARALEAILDNIGMIVCGPAATVAEAQAILHKETPDIAVVDINLRGEMAYGLVAHLNEREVPVIVVSGYEVLPCIQESVAAVLTKPIRAEALLTHLRRIVAGRTKA